MSNQLTSFQKYIQQVPPQTKLWRYLTPDKLLYLLRDAALYFCQLKKFKDANEGEIPVFSHIILKGTPLEDAYNQFKDAPNFWRSYCGASCWNMDKELSQTLWDEYTGGTGAAIQTTVEKLQKSVGFSTKYGKVEYGAMDYSGQLPTVQGGLDIVMFYKTPDYAFENEYRALLYAISKHPYSISKMNHYGGLNISVNLNELIEKIYLSKHQPLVQSIIINKLIDANDLGSKIVFI